MMKSSAANACSPADANNSPARNESAAECASRIESSSRSRSARSRWRATDSPTSGCSASATASQSASSSCSSALRLFDRPRYAASTTSACTKRHRPAASSSGWIRPARSSDEIAASTSSGASSRGEGLEPRSPEPAAFDGCSLEDQARAGFEAVEPGGEERLQRPRDLHVGIVRSLPAAVDEQSLIRKHRRELLEVERIAFGRLADPVDDGHGGVSAQQQLADRAGVLRCERREGRRDRARLAGGPGRALLHELWPGQAEEEHGAVHALDDGVGQVEHRRLCRMQVVEHDDQRPVGGEHLEQAADRPRGVGPDRRADSEELRETVTDGRTVRLRDHPLAQRTRNCRGVPGWRSGCLSEKFDEWRERHSLAVGGSLSHEHRRPFRGLGRERGGQPRLSHPGRSQDRDEHARPGIDRVLQRLLELPQRALAPDERRRIARCHRSDRDDAPGRQGSGLALGVQRLDRLGHDRAAHESPRRLTDQHGHRARRPIAAARPCSWRRRPPARPRRTEPPRRS